MHTNIDAVNKDFLSHPHLPITTNKPAEFKVYTKVKMPVTLLGFACNKCTRIANGYIYLSFDRHCLAWSHHSECNGSSLSRPACLTDRPDTRFPIYFTVNCTSNRF